MRLNETLRESILAAIVALNKTDDVVNKRLANQLRSDLIDTENEGYKMKNMKLDKVVKDYILDAIDCTQYEGVECKDGKEYLAFLYKTFKAEYGWNIERVGEVSAFKEWMQGLPSSFNIDFENYKILQLAVKWGSIPENYTERQADKILENWFNFIAVKTFQLFKHYKVV
jgi:hypothetical protein